MHARRTDSAASRLFPLVLVGHKESCLGWVEEGLQLFAAALVLSAPKRTWDAVTSETTDGWSHLVPAICGMTVLGAMLFVVAVFFS